MLAAGGCRERSDGLYSVITYLSAKMLEELILATGVSLITSLVVFYVLSLQGQWVLFFLAFLVTLSNGIGALLAALVRLSPCWCVQSRLDTC